VVVVGGDDDAVNSPASGQKEIMSDRAANRNTRVPRTIERISSGIQIVSSFFFSISSSCGKLKEENRSIQPRAASVMTRPVRVSPTDPLRKNESVRDVVKVVGVDCDSDVREEVSVMLLVMLLVLVVVVLVLVAS